MFYNPFRKKWVYSMRTDFGSNYRGVRARSYQEADTFEEGATLDHPVYWARADRCDPMEPTIGDKPTLYNLDAIAYESIMLGAFSIFLGPENDVSVKTGIPKHTELHLAYSRDGFHWSRPEERIPFLAPNRADPNSWERGYIHSNNGICIIHGNELWFYYTAFRGDSTKIFEHGHASGMYANASMGLAVLRRDGFASLNAYGYTGHMTTRPLWFSGEYLFVNADFHTGGMRVAVLDENGDVIPGYGFDDCCRYMENSTCARIKWNGHSDLSQLSETVIRLQFEGTNGALYAFWITDAADGKSHGCLAAGAVGCDSIWDN